MSSKTDSKKTTPTAAQREKVLALHTDGVKFGDIVAKVGLSVAATDRIIDSARGAARMADVAEQYTVDGATEVQTFWFGQPETAHLHDGPFGELVALTIAADLSWTEHREVFSAADAARSDEAAIAAVQAKREELKDRIAAVEAGTWKRPTAARKAVDPVQALLAKMDSLSEADIAALKAALGETEKAEEVVEA